MQRPKIIDTNYLVTLSKKQRAFHTIVEPLNKIQVKQLTNAGFKSSNNPYLPSTTLVLDITGEKDVIFNKFKNDARGYITKNNNLQFKHHTKDSVSDFRQAWVKAVGFKRYVPSLKNLRSLKRSFYKNSLFITTKNMESGAIFLVGKKSGYYWQAFTNDVGRQSKSQYNIVWEGIKWSKDVGATNIDFEGVYDDRFPNKSWLGFTHFKKSFGGNVTQYPGAFTKIAFPI